MTAGYSKKPLVQKLGIKSGMSVMPVNEPEHYFELLGELPGKVKLIRKSNPDPVDFIHLFAPDEHTLHHQFPPLKSILKKKGMLWVSWIKKSSKLETGISENDVRNLGLKLGLVDVKICAVDEDWSALKFMYRKKDQ